MHRTYFGKMIHNNARMKFCRYSQPANVSDVEHIPSWLFRSSCQYTHAHAVVSCSYLTPTKKVSPFKLPFLKWHRWGNWYFDTTCIQGVVRGCCISLALKAPNQAKTSPFNALKSTTTAMGHKQRLKCCDSVSGISQLKHFNVLILLLPEWNYCLST